MSVADVWNAYFEGRHEAVLTAGAESSEIMHITGLSLISLGRIEEGNTLLIASSLARPTAQHYANSCVALLDAGYPELAKAHALTGLKDFMVDPNLNFCAGNVFNALGDYTNAEKQFRVAYHYDPNHWEAAMNLANVLRRIGQYEAALEFYEKEVLPKTNVDLAGEIRATLNMAVTLSDLGRDEEAIVVFDTLAARGVIDSAEMDFNRATLRLKLGDYSEGWQLYRRRWDCPMAAKDVAAFKKPRLANLEEGRGKHVLFGHEQGFGDSIQFVRYAPLLAAEGLRVTILCPEPLRRLFEPMGFPVVTNRDLEYDFECPMLDAPALFGTTLDTIPAAIPYLTVPQDLIDAHSLPPLEDTTKVGIVWAGQSRDAAEMKLIDNKRSIDVATFLPLFERDDCEIYSLQFGERSSDPLRSLPDDYWPVAVLEPDFDFLDTAAVIMNLDLVIAVDTSTAHLAAALGKPVWLLSRFDGCWRWLKDRDDSPWYPGLRIFHQKQRLEWRSVLEEVNEALNRLND